MLRRLLLSIGLTAAALAGCAPEPPPSATTPGPVFVLGFDGLAPDVLEGFEKEGILPAFAKLREEGATGRVRSTIPMISPPAWATVSTGVSPVAHGIWSFWVPEGGNPRGRFVDATARLAPAIWQDLSARGRTVGVINVPITCPPDSVNGFMIAGFPYPENAPLTWPPTLEREILAEGYERDAWLGPPAAGEELEWLHRMRAVGDARRRIGLKRLFDAKPDFSFIVFTTPDRIQHHLWKFTDPKHPYYRPDAPDELQSAVRDIYVWCDDILAEVRSKLPRDATLIVVSDHGFGPAYAGLSKATVLAGLGGAGEGDVAESRNLFGGDFWLGDVDDTTRAEFRRRLADLTDPSGRSVVKEVHDTRETESAGYGLELGPDLVAEEADGYLFVPGAPNAPLVGGLAPGAFSGWHRRLGYFAVVGHPVDPGAAVRDLDLADVPAMAMHLLGEIIPRRYTHNIPRRVFPLTYFVERPMVFDGAPDGDLLRPGERPPAADNAELQEQLQSLGYLK
ncbi:MAG: alkaline phosphatase family protein [bacterium]